MPYHRRRAGWEALAWVFSKILGRKIVWSIRSGIPLETINTIRTIIADDHCMIREGLRLLLSGLADVEVVGEAADGRTAVRLARKLSPDVIIMDVAMPGLNGIEATRQLTALGSGTKIIALSGKATTQSAMEMLKAGASAFVRKESAFSELAEALHAVMAGRVHVSPDLAGVLELPTSNGNGHRAVSLSGREREVLQLMSEGKATKEIAPCLNVSVKTIETHRRNLMEKLKMYSVAELTKYAIIEGITSVET